MFIAKILTGDDEGYSKLKQIAKENVKVLLSENKKLISISFVALIQTIKADPEIVKLIQDISSANDSKEHRDDNNNNNAIKYLESNKDRLSDLGEKNYENLADALTNNIMNTSASSSSNPSDHFRSSSSTLQNPFNQSDSYRIEESETYHNSKGDIAD